MLICLQDQTDNNREICAGMYSKRSWGGPVDPFILIDFIKPNDIPKDQDPIASLLLFEWDDRNLIGIPNPDIDGATLGICNDDFVKKGACNTTNIGEFILAPNATDKSAALIVSMAVHLKDPKPIHYNIKKTGYYCVVTDVFTAKEYKAVAEFRNAYGELQATQIPKLPFYGGISILYALVAGFWGFLYYQHRHDILAVQNYITAILMFLVVEMILTWGFYEYKNRHGSNVGAKVFLIIVAILNAVRSSFSFFLLLIVCMGYGVVKPTLGKTMIYVRWLAAAHFIFGLVYAIADHIVAPEDAGLVFLFIALPLAMTMTAFYVWILNSLNFTLKDLNERKQHVKEGMYKKLWWSILASCFVILAFFFFNTFTFTGLTDPNFLPDHWKTRWFVLDGWLNIVYFAEVAWIAYVWRPTANNRRFAMSDEIAQDDDGNFEIADIGMPGDSDDEDEEAKIGNKSNMPSSGLGTSVGATSAAGPSHASGYHQPGASRNVPRESLEGETIFAVGEDGDKFSDDGSEEDTKLVRGR
jgi:hypothetical protein